MKRSIIDWPNCSIADCPHKVCLGVSSNLCHAHAHRLPLKPEDSNVFGYFDLMTHRAQQVSNSD